jgi:hypothetical protein
MQPLPYAPPPPPHQPLKKGTPFLHCLAGASVWYVAFVVAFVIISIKFGFTLGNLVPALLIGAAIWGMTSTAMWLILLKARIRPWVLIFVSIPVYLVVWIVLNGLLGAIAAVFMHVRG